MIDELPQPLGIHIDLDRLSGGDDRRAVVRDALIGDLDHEGSEIDRDHGQRHLPGVDLVQREKVVRETGKAAGVPADLVVRGALRAIELHRIREERHRDIDAHDGLTKLDGEDGARLLLPQVFEQQGPFAMPRPRDEYREHDEPGRQDDAAGDGRDLRCRRDRRCRPADRSGRPKDERHALIEPPRGGRDGDEQDRRGLDRARRQPLGREGGRDGGGKSDSEARAAARR